MCLQIIAKVQTHTLNDILNEIKRPTIIEISEESLRVEISTPSEIYNEESNELIDILVAPIIVLSEKKKLMKSLL